MMRQWSFIEIMSTTDDLSRLNFVPSLVPRRSEGLGYETTLSLAGPSPHARSKSGDEARFERSNWRMRT